MFNRKDMNRLRYTKQDSPNGVNSCRYPVQEQYDQLLLPHSSDRRGKMDFIFRIDQLFPGSHELN
jgi:hypothetical protein